MLFPQEVMLCCLIASYGAAKDVLSMFHWWVCTLLKTHFSHTDTIKINFVLGTVLCGF